jgi:hypothetical protein|tara:strand:+ start:2285 stop:2464 length:180 start_codon:yes stop_codon:yes gene_type:complete
MTMKSRLLHLFRLSLTRELAWDTGRERKWSPLASDDAHLYSPLGSRNGRRAAFCRGRAR